MTIYIDSEFKCHGSDPEGAMTAAETDFFDDKCAAMVAELADARAAPAKTAVWI